VSSRSSTNYGASTSLGWHHDRERTSIGVNYRATFSGNSVNSGANALNQSFSLSASRRYGQKFTISLSATASDNSVIEFLQQPSNLALLSQLPLAFNDLAASFGVGQFSGLQTASMAAGATSPGTSLARSQLLGDRVLSYNANLTATYSISTRLSVYVGGFTAAGQHRYGGQNFAMPRSMGFNGGAGFAYSLSPRTVAGMSMSVYRNLNLYQSAVTSSVSGNFGRKMGMHWFMNSSGGYSYSVITKQIYAAPSTRQFVGNAALGYQLQSQTIVANYVRTAAEMSGFATGVSSALNFAWSWRRSGARWGMVVSGGQNHNGQNGFSTITGWHGNTAFTINPTAQTALSLSYGYAQSTGTFLTQTNHVKIQSVRLTMGWNPHGRLPTRPSVPGGITTDIGEMQR
jgi:hypothetical protein